MGNRVDDHQQERALKARSSAYRRTAIRGMGLSWPGRFSLSTPRSIWILRIEGCTDAVMTSSLPMT